MNTIEADTAATPLPPWQARALLAAAAALALFCVALTLSPQASGNVGKKRSGAGDVALYQAEVDRIRGGASYYEAVATELVARGYPTRSVFNWRTPLPIWLIGRLPDPDMAKGLLVALALGAMVVLGAAVARDAGEATGWPLATAILLIGALMFNVLGNLYVSPILWAATLICLSVAAYGLERPGWGVALGIAALFCRDLALPYCVFSAGWACWSRRREAWWWLGGLAGWSLFFAWHWLQVQPHIGPDARAHAGGWIDFGGTAFVLATAQVHAYWLLLPQWVTGLYFTAAMIGLWGWQTPLGRRIAGVLCLYIVTFAIVGREFNQYWGVLIAPLYCPAAARAPRVLRQWWRAACRKAIPSSATATAIVDRGLGPAG